MLSNKHLLMSQIKRSVYELKPDKKKLRNHPFLMPKKKEDILDLIRIFSNYAERAYTQQPELVRLVKENPSKKNSIKLAKCRRNMYQGNSLKDNLTLQCYMKNIIGLKGYFQNRNTIYGVFGDQEHTIVVRVSDKFKKLNPAQDVLNVSNQWPAYYQETNDENNMNSTMLRRCYAQWLASHNSYLRRVEIHNKVKSEIQCGIEKGVISLVD